MSTVPEKLSLRVKGPVNSRKEVYIPRPSDDEVFALLKDGEYCNVVSSRQMGKTSLLFLTKLRLDEMGVKSCSIDVGGYLGEVPPENADAWYQDLLQEIADQLGLSLDVAAWWRSNSSATPNRRLIQFFRDEVAVRAGAPVVVFLDEIESTLKLSYTDDFFLAIRAMHNDRTREPAFERITFCLMGVVTPNELIKNQRSTPYNVGQTIELRDFDPERDDLGALYSAVDDYPETGKRLAAAVFGWTGGHPYLTMKHCAEVARSAMKSAQEVDRLFERSYTSLEAVKSDEHFETVLRFVRERVDDNDRLTALTLYRRIYRGRREFDRTTPAHIALKLSGLVKRDERGLLIVRNRIYRRVFTDNWAGKTMPPVAQAVRNARRWGGATTILFLLTAGIWYEGIYPYQLANRLSAAVAQDRDAIDVYQFLHSIPFYSSKADRIRATLFDRRAANAGLRKKRDEAVLWRLKALSVLPTDRRRREAALLIGEDYPQLVRTIHLVESEKVVLSGDGHVVAVTESGILRLWSTETAEPIGKLLYNGQSLSSLPALSGDGRVAAVVAPAGTLFVDLWRTESGERIGKPFYCGLTLLLPLALSDDGRVVAAAIDPTAHSPTHYIVHLWRTESGEPVGIPLDCGEKTIVPILALSGDGRVVAAVVGNTWKDDDVHLRLWRTESGEPIGKPLDCKEKTIDASLALSGDGRVMAAAVIDRRHIEAKHGTVRIWRTGSGEPIGKPVDIWETTDPRVALSGDGRVVVAGNNQGIVRVWHVDTGQPVGKALSLGVGVQGVAVSNDGRVVAVGDQLLRVWRFVLDEPVDRPPDQPVQGNPLELLHEWEKRLALTIDPNGQIVPILAGETSPRPGPRGLAP